MIEHHEKNKNINHNDLLLKENMSGCAPLDRSWLRADLMITQIWPCFLLISLKKKKKKHVEAQIGP